MTLDDMDAVLARLESGPVVVPARLAWEPPTEMEAVRAWVEARGLKRGRHASPSATRLAEDLHRYAVGAGWHRDYVPAVRLGVVLRALGFRAYHRMGRKGFLVDEVSAKRLVLAYPPKRKVQHRPPRKHLVRHRQPKSFWAPFKGRGLPVVNTLGRVYPSARRAADVLRTSRASLQRAAKYGEGCNGLLWRYLTPEEVRCIPPTAREGDVIPWLAWNRVVSVQCPRCGVESSAGQADGQQASSPGPLPPGSPTGVASAGGGSPTHIP